MTLPRPHVSVAAAHAGWRKADAHYRRVASEYFSFGDASEPVQPPQQPIDHEALVRLVRLRAAAAEAQAVYTEAIRAVASWN
jgi:hypothetical protein